MRCGRGWVLGLVMLGAAGCDRSVPTETVLPPVPEPTVAPPRSGGGGGGGIVCAPGAQCARLRGTVVEDYSARPLEGALVSVIGAGGVLEMRTDGYGSFDTGFNLPVNDPIEVQVSTPGHSTLVMTMRIGSAASIQARLVSDTIVAADIFGTVQAGRTWSPFVPLPGAVVRLRTGLHNYEGPVTDSVVVDTAGTYRLLQVRPGPVSMTVDAPGYASVRSTWEHTTRRPESRRWLLARE